VVFSSRAFFSIRSDAVALEGAQVLDEDLAHQVVHLVLDAHRHQAGGFALEEFAVAVERAHGHPRVAAHLVVDRRHRQAALVGHHHVLAAGDDLRVDQHQGPVACVGGVHHDHAFVHVDLGRGQAHALGVVHGLEHVVDQAADAIVDLPPRAWPRCAAGDRDSGGCSATP
jgi:hypothetical protein